VEPLEDPVLVSFSKCLEAGLLAVWRRVPRRCLVTYSFDAAGQQLKQPTKGHDDKNQLSQCKELWLFWYGEKPDTIKNLVHEDLKEVDDSGGSWETGIPYEVRTLLFKAVNNLIERSLLSREFVRLGKWFVQPFEGVERPGQNKATTTHLSFSFQYFVHGESAVCTSVDVRQHPAVRRLGQHHLTSAANLSANVHVVLAPYGMAGTLTGTSFSESDPSAKKLLDEWRAFWPLYNNCYTSRDQTGLQVDMPAAVEVVVGGAKLVYPTSYVLVTDVDNHLIVGASDMSSEDGIEPSPFTSNNHELSRTLDLSSYGERVHTDGVLPEQEFGHGCDRDGGAGSSDMNSNMLSVQLNSWEFLNPDKTFKRRSKRVKKEFKDQTKNSKSKGVPMFKKGELGDPIMWGLDQDGFNSARLSHPVHHGHGGSGVTHQSPASVGPVTPGHGPMSVKSETAMPLLSPHTNGPATPAYTPGEPGSITFNPATPSTPGGPKSVGIPASPFRAVNPPLPGIKTEAGVVTTNGSSTNTTPTVSPKGKRPLLPSKEYEEISDNLTLSSAYDYTSLSAWLSHPVKKSRPNEGPKTTPVRPMHRRKSQSSIFAPVDTTELLQIRTPIKNQTEPAKNPVVPVTNGIVDTNIVKPKQEFDENKGLGEEENLFSADGLKASMTDLDNMFDDSDTESGLGCVPTPPNSVKPHNNQDDEYTSTKYMKKEHPSSLANDQLHQMFPTPPSLEHPNHHSPGMDQDMVDVKAEPLSPRPDHQLQHLGGNSLQFQNTGVSDMYLDSDDYFDHSFMLSSSKLFAPLPPSSLPSSSLPPLIIPDSLKFKSNYKPGSIMPPQNHPISISSSSSTSLKPGLSPISPAMSDTNPKSNKSTNPPSVGGPRSVGPTTPRVPHTPLGGNNSDSNSQHTPLANSLTINLVLSDSILNLYRDINFNSCTMCVCTNDGNIKGGESLMYMPLFAGDDDHNCTCGYSAIINRKLSHLAGMFLEDEREVTSVQEDVYFKKKLSLLLLDPKSQEQGEHRFNERASIVDNVSWKMIELIQQQAGLFTSEYNTLISYSQQYFKHSSRQHLINQVEEMDLTDTIWAALETVRASATDTGKSDLDMGGKVGCLHRWAVIPAAGPLSSEDIVRVMKCLLPILNTSLHVRNGTENTKLNVDGPLTWRQFHRMAGVTTKGNTDDGCEPLPIPSLMVGYEREWMSVSPLSLYYWDSLNFEPWGAGRDVAYLCVAPDNENILNEVRVFLRALTNGYESLKLGRHVGITKALKLREGILRVGAKRTANLDKEGDHDEWFSSIGDAPMAELLRLYSKVCHHYLAPLLSQIPLDAKELFKKDTSYNSQMAPPESTELKLEPGENGEASKENMDPLTQDLQDQTSEPPAVVIYMIDPFSMGVDNMELQRLSSMAMMRCFSALMYDQRIPANIRQSVYLQTVSLDTVYSVAGDCARAGQMSISTRPPHVSRSTHLLKQLCLSVYTQSMKPNNFNTTAKSLTGFGPASSSDKHLKSIDAKDQVTNNYKHMYCPPFILAPASQRSKKNGDADTEKSTVLFVNYCLSDDQKHLLASLSDDRGEMVRTTVINVNIPNRTRRKKASARRVGLKRLFDWILSVMSLSLVPWRLVIGRLGRIGHGELRGWSSLLSRKSLKKAIKQLKEQCNWKSDLPTILSVCLISLEPDSVLRLMHDQATPDERFRQVSANQCNLSTPKDVSVTHILVFPTSATAQSAVQAAFNDHQTGDNGDNDFGFGIDMNELGNPNDNDNELELGDLNDIFDADPFSSAGGVTSPNGSPRGTQMSQPGSPGSAIPGSDPAFRYGQEEPGDGLEILQQPLALGYLTSTAKTGPMPRWFWSSAPHLESANPVFLKSALHINCANLALAGDDGLVPQSASGRVHSLDSNYTTDVLRYVLEGYNSLSWLVLDPVTHDRSSCLPVHVQALTQLYHALAALV